MVLKISKFSFLAFIIVMIAFSYLILDPIYGEVRVESGTTLVGNQTVIMNQPSAPVNIILAVTGLSGVAGLFWGIYQYRESRHDKRKQTFFELTKEFDTSKAMLPAKKILDTWALDYSTEKGLFISPDGGFHLGTIEWILAPGYSDREKAEKDLTFYLGDYSQKEKDEAWQQLRDSFDALFDFFERLTYLQKLKRITDEELQYFAAFIKPAKETEEIKTFLDAWGYKWHKSL